MKKLDFFRGIQNFVAPSTIEKEKIFTEYYLFITVDLPSKVFSFTIGGQTIKFWKFGYFVGR